MLSLPDVGERVLDEDAEGCLSILGESADLARPDRAVVTGFDAAGAPVIVVGTGMLARCLQHEVDHLDGGLYIDRLSLLQRRRILRAHGRTMSLPPHPAECCRCRIGRAPTQQPAR